MKFWIWWGKWFWKTLDNMTKLEEHRKSIVEEPLLAAKDRRKSAVGEV